MISTSDFQYQHIGRVFHLSVYKKNFPACQEINQLRFLCAFIGYWRSWEKTWRPERIWYETFGSPRLI